MPGGELIIITVGFLVVMMVFILGVSLWETLATKQYAPAPKGESPHYSNYAVTKNCEAEELGLLNGGDYVQNRGGFYKVVMTLWMTPEYDTLIFVAGGTIGGMEYKGTKAFTHLGDGTFLVTQDNPDMADMSGMVRQNLLLNGSVIELLKSHRQKLNDLPEAQKFKPDGMLEQYEMVSQIRAEKLVSRGLARFVNEERTRYKLTIFGALRQATIGYLGQFSKAFAQQHRYLK